MQKILFLLLLVVILIVSCEKKLNENELVMWSHEEVPFNEGFKKVFEKYTQKTGVKITLLTFPYDAYIQKVKTSFASKTGPDLMEVFGVWMLEYKKSGAVLPLSPELALYVKNNYFDTAQGAYRDGNDIYGLPFEYNIEGSLMLTNPTLFKKHGVPYPPQTWEELVNAAKQLTVYEQGKITQRGFDFTSYDSVVNIFLQLVLQQNQSYINPTTNKVNFTSKEAIKAMQVMKDLVVKEKVVDLSLFGGNEEPQDLLFKGITAMAQRGPWSIGYGEELYEIVYGKDFDYEIMPSFVDDTPPLFASESGWGLVVPASSSKSALAIDFLQFFSEEENMALFNSISKTIPSNKQILLDKTFMANNPIVEKLKDFLQYGKYIGNINTDFLKDQFFNVFPEIVSGDITVEEGLSLIETSVNNF